MKNMRLIVGLGNPGKEYQGTRHNVGFAVLDKLISMISGRVLAPNLQSVGVRGEVPTGIPGFRKFQRFEGKIVRIGDVLLLKPMTFMNKSGVSIKKVMNFYKIKLEDLWVIHDDLDIELGKFKIQMGKGPKKHNGVLSVETELGAKDFWRVRIGVENRQDKRIPGEKYVLMKFSEDEKKRLMKVIEEVVEEIR